MKALVRTINNIAVTDSLTLAEGSGNDHASIIKLVRNYQHDLEEFGRVGFEIQPFETAGGTQSRTVAFLNEHQATLLLTYMRNTDRIRRFKKELVKAFFAMANRLNCQSPIDGAAIREELAAMRELLRKTQATGNKGVCQQQRRDRLEMARKAGRYLRMGLSKAETARLINVSPKALNRLIKKAKAVGGILRSERSADQTPGTKSGLTPSEDNLLKAIINMGLSEYWFMQDSVSRD